MEKNIIYYDGHCVMCNGFVQLLMNIDRHDAFFFAPLDGPTAKKNKILEQVGNVDSVVLQKSTSAIYTKSDALFEIISILGGVWQLINIFKVLPKRINDIFYDTIALNRKTLLGTKKSCRLPSIKQRAKLLP